ncbi:hypothetical protein P168DRAFT_332836 [Aspergillus campestris IBT 28561]|uniref:Uncharacterized protein n=1 Tax=Aspergillus campestris (strain IBT 28561) TaxID=1392248 RepID=A0A2I1DHB7_ASPC2|nr:uncharacterized protein P168DRAFT_332836 [Aspergillus campestris IBT 28561]PKY09261.1 hypothetical protein P168DRAFT_332836 [Aspergillus campestris IBT 28561]
MDRVYKYKATGPEDDTARVLQVFLDNLPEDGKQNLQTDIYACQSDDQIRAHAKCLIDGLLYPLKSRSCTPSIVTTPALFLSDSLQIKPPAMIETEARLLQVKKDCLKRDGYRCLVSRVADEGIPLDQGDEETHWCETKCAHIVPFCLNIWDTVVERNAKAEIWANLNRCFPMLWNQLHFTQDSITDHRNALTLFPMVYDHFRAFKFALEKTDVEHRYKIINYRPRDIVGTYFPGSGIVSFEAADSRFELPSPELLEFHATIARILHASGKAKQAEKILKDRKSTTSLAGDGSTDICAMLSTTSLGVLGSRASCQHSTDKPTTSTGEKN